MFGIEQEYTFFKDGRPLGFPAGGFPAPQGGYYCGVGADEVFGREIVETAPGPLPGRRPGHLPASTPRSCPASGSSRSARSAPLTVSDHLWVARWLLYRTAEDFGISATLDAKPVKGDWNGAGAHTNFSTKAMREGYDAIITACESLGADRTRSWSTSSQLRRRHRGPSDRPARDRPVERVQLRRLRPRRLGAHPVAGRGGQEGLHRGPPPERQRRPVRGHPPASSTPAAPRWRRPARSDPRPAPIRIRRKQPLTMFPLVRGCFALPPVGHRARRPGPAAGRRGDLHAL